MPERAVGFCGARDASEKGIAVAVDYATQLAAWGWVVVSRGARGVDRAIIRYAASLKLWSWSRLARQRYGCRRPSSWPTMLNRL